MQPITEHDPDIHDFFSRVVMPITAMKVSTTHHANTDDISITRLGDNSNQETTIAELSEMLGWVSLDINNPADIFKLLKHVTVKISVSVDIDELNQIATRHRNQAMIDELLKFYAPFPLLRSLFGTSMTQQRYKTRRKELGLADQGGRPCTLTGQQESDLFDVWVKHISGNRWDSLPLMIITIHKYTTIQIRDFWPYFAPAFAAMTQALNANNDGIAIAPTIEMPTTIYQGTDIKQNTFTFYNSNSTNPIALYSKSQ
jgi:hypothetical protein